MREENVFLEAIGEAEAFFNKRLTDSQTRYYWNECGHWSRVDFKRGIKELIRTHKPIPSNFPTVTELNAIVSDMGGVNPNARPFVRRRCHSCYDTGYLVIECKSKHDPPREEIFRCGHCRNWELEDLDKRGYRADHGVWRFSIPRITQDEFDFSIREKYRRRGISARIKRSQDLDKYRLKADERFGLKEGLPVYECQRLEEVALVPVAEVDKLAENLF